MKKVVMTFLIALSAVTMLAFNGLKVKADEAIIDLYPNDDKTQLEGKFGNSNWVLEFGGYRYHTVSFMARFASHFTGIEDAEKVEFSGADVPKIDGNAMGGFFHNNSDKEIFLADAERAPLTGTMNRIWAHFNEEGKLVMFEDHIQVYYITKVEGQEYYRLATEAEIKTFDEAEEGAKPANIKQTHIRMVLDEDGSGYKIEPLGYLKWTHEDYVPEEIVAEDGTVTPANPVESILLDYDPNKVRMGKGWTSLHFSTWDRGQAKFMDFVKTLPGHLIANTEKVEVKYNDPAPIFYGLNELDVNDQEQGVNIVYDFATDAFVSSAINNVTAQHITKQEFFDKKHTNVDFKIEVLSEENEVLETVNVPYVVADSKYVPEKDVFETIDTEDFGARYKLRYTSASPVTAENTKVEEAIIDVGVLPININNVGPRFINEGTYIDLLEGITADDNYGNDITSSLTWSANDPDFNRYSAQTGKFDITLHANYWYAAGGALDITQPITLGNGDKSFTFPLERINPTDNIAIGTATPLRQGVIITDAKIFADQIDNNLNKSDMNKLWGNVYYVLLDASGTVESYYNYTTAKYMVNGVVTDITGKVGDKATRNEFLAKLQFGERYTFIAATATAATDGINNILATVDENTKFDGIPVYFNVVGERTFTLTVTDTTPPAVKVLQKEFTIYTDNTFENALEAITSNIQVTEQQEYTVNVAGVNRISITEAGEHDISVLVTDGQNDVTVEFKLIVKEAKASQQELTDSLNDALDKIAELETQLDAKPEGTPLVLVIVISVATALLSFGGAFLLMILRKK